MDRAKEFLKKQWYVAVIPLVLILALLGTWLGEEIYYRDRALPGTHLIGRDVSGLTSEEIRKQAIHDYRIMKVTVRLGETSKTINLRELGVTPDLDATVKNVIAAGRVMNPIKKYVEKKQHNVTLMLSIDENVLWPFVTANFQGVTEPIINPAPKYNAQKKLFETVPGKIGRNVDLKDFKRFTDNLISDYDKNIYNLRIIDIAPPIGIDDSDYSASIANKRLSVPVTYTIGEKPVYTLKPADIAGMLIFIEDNENGEYRVSFDPERIVSIVGKAVDKPRVDAHAETDIDGNIFIVYREGRDGTVVANTSKEVIETSKALATMKESVVSLTTKVDKFQTVVDGADHWVDVNLSEQRVRLYAGTDEVVTFLCSSGLPATPTVIGDFAVYYKTEKQTMNDTPNVRWNSFFIGDYALHGAWWHNNFGRPMSHGCVNLTEYNAYMTYFWAPIGTPVKVHY
jgi:lipoprotein-anchoring transpeptidase ErfK/SrfK